MDDKSESEEAAPNGRLAIKHINAQSLERKIDELQAESEGVDIIAISEMWFHKDIQDEDMALGVYHPPVRMDREGNRYGGVAIYCSQDLSIKPRKDIKVEGVEAAWVETHLLDKVVLVGVVYRPPNEKADYLQKLDDHLELSS